MVEQRHPLCAGSLGQRHGVLGGRVPERGPRRQLGGRVLRVVEQQVHARPRAPWPRRGTAPSRRGRGRARSGRGRRGRRAMCRRRSPGSRTPGHPGAGSRGPARRSPRACGAPSSMAPNVHVPRSSAGRDREEGRAHRTSTAGRASRPVPARARARAPRRPGGRRRGRTAGPGCGPSGGGRTAACPRNGSPPSSSESRRSPCHRRARGSAPPRRHGRSRRTTCGRRRRRTHGPTAGVEPRTPHRCTRIQRAGARGGALRQRCAVDAAVEATRQADGSPCGAPRSSPAPVEQHGTSVATARHPCRTSSLARLQAALDASRAWRRRASRSWTARARGPTRPG